MSILLMPTDVMEKITEYIDFQSVLTLRKVCRNLREYIDDTTPASNVTNIRISVNSRRITVDYGSFEGGFKVEYRPRGNGISVEKTYPLKGKWLENKKNRLKMDHVDVFINDLRIILRHQKIVLQYFKLEDLKQENQFENRFFQMLKEVLWAQKRLLQVEFFLINSSKQYQILSILPFLDPETLGTMIISDPKDYNIMEPKNYLEVDRLVTLEQWRRVDKLEIGKLWIGTSFMNLLHYKEAEFALPYILWEHLIFLKNVLLHCPKFQRLVLKYSRYYGDEPLYIRTFGIAHFRCGGTRIPTHNWFFQIPTSNDVLHILNYNGHRKFLFRRRDVSVVPDGVLIQN